MNATNGHPAFPVTCDDGVQYFGMNLLDYFAAQAMQGWLASYSGISEHPVDAGHAKAIAACSYALADAMLAERENW